MGGCGWMKVAEGVVKKERGGTEHRRGRTGRWRRREGIRGGDAGSTFFVQYVVTTPLDI